MEKITAAPVDPGEQAARERGWLLAEALKASDRAAVWQVRAMRCEGSETREHYQRIARCCRADAEAHLAGLTGR